MKKPLFLFVAAMLSITSVPAGAGTLFTDLGPAGYYYTTGSGVGVDGGTGTTAMSFVASGSGSEAVSQIDLGIFAYNAYNTFTVSIWTSVSGLPGAQVSGASWSTSTPNISNACWEPSDCNLVSITGITGVSLVGGNSYYLVLKSLDPTGAFTNLLWNYNDQNVNGTFLYGSPGPNLSITNNWTEGAFDVLGGPPAVGVQTPEPPTLLLILGGMLIGLSWRYAARSQTGGFLRLDTIFRK